MSLQVQPFVSWNISETGVCRPSLGIIGSGVQCYHIAAYRVKPVFLS